VADKNFKVKTGLSLPQPLPADQGGTGQSSLTNALNAMLPVQTSASGKYLTTDGTTTSWATVTTSFTGMPSSSISSNSTLSSNYKYFVDTSISRTLTLPSSPSLGDEIYIYDASGTSGTYNITVARNSNLINGNAGNFIVDIDGGAASFIYTGSTYGWKVG